MATKRDKPEEIAIKLWQVDALLRQGPPQNNAIYHALIPSRHITATGADGEVRAPPRLHLARAQDSRLKVTLGLLPCR